MADVDNFDIDIYGDEAGPEEYNGENGGNNYNYEEESAQPMNGQESYDNSSKPSNDTSNQNKMDITPSNQPEPTQPTQGVKRKTMDERSFDPNSTNAVQITELHWWFTEDDLRGLCDGAGCEEEIKEITFNEHKVNGKSKGQVYVEFYSQAAATALKHYIDKIEASKADPKKAIATFFPGQQNPYKTLPKDSNRRNDVRGPSGDRNYSGGSGQSFSGNNNFSGNFRGGRGGQFNSQNRGGGMNNGWNRGGGSGFSGPMNPMGGPMGNPMGGMGYGGGMNNNFNNFNRGGGMMNGGMRGGMGPNRGRGGNMGSPGPNMMNPMGNMNMGMGMGGMGMNPGMMNMGGAFPNQPQFQQPYFQGQPAGGDWGNPHGAKRHRPNE